ncbi:MAG: hypothetical protein KAX55_02325 [Propionivibrio sp.]|nr:hypothetical protein [Propionivibrio sp.]
MKRRNLELQQGKRLLAAIAALLLVVPFLCGLLVLLGFLLLEFLWGGAGAVLSAFEDWTRPSIFIDNLWFRLMLGFVAFVTVGLPIWGWYRIFVASGYISEDTNRRIVSGDLPVVGGYWKPLMYAGYCTLCAGGTYLSIQQQSVAGVVLFGGGGVWLFVLSMRELAAWWEEFRK